MPLRIRPTQLHNHVEHLMKGGIYNKAPIWYPVMKMYPPGQSLLRTPNNNTNTLNDNSNSNTDMLNDNDVNIEITSDPINKSTKKRSRSSNSLKHLRTKSIRPQPIVYPEDALRRQFYRDHPYELLRPRMLMEKEIPVDKVWKSLVGDDEDPSEVTGESVVQYQMYLMAHKSMSQRQAYAVACNEFYEIRAREEIEQRVAEEQAIAFGAVRKKSEVEKTMWKEYKEIRRTRNAV
ncbi:1496_t:CDS:2 [Ambispora gerdemannii]|uniref:Small ribosomal subunit protein mS23 n=1 Tax=Ambispora gerdemannii TaxID=144530 RepID=A0A9N8V3V4_9GLOM|nr:1496_t:CDS:2 [Ambispora gerdemannii]